MNDRSHQVGDVSYADQTVLHPLGLAFVVLAGLAMLCLPRRYAVWPMLAIACFVAPAQRLVVLGLDFNLLRIMVLFAWARILMRNEAVGFRWNALDTVLLLWSFVTVASYTMLTGSASGFINRLGVTFNAVGMYFAFRCLVRDWADLEAAVRGFIVLSVPVAVFFLIEKATGRNGFAFFGGVPAVTAVREGRLRCQGAFAHPILAGCFWASVLPLMAALWWKGRAARPWVVTGLVCACLIIVACASSTPVMAVIFGLVGAGLFPLRRHMRFVRWGLPLMLVGLHLVMKAPVWHLIARVNVVGGSTGWHRYKIIDSAISHWSEWWFIGTQRIDHWNVWANDITNQYVAEGIMGGAAKLGLFVLAIALAFGMVGRLWRSVDHDRYKPYMAWALGVALFVHCMNYMAVSYFGQIIVVWYLQLAMIASLAPARRAVPRAAPAPVGSVGRAVPA